MIAVITSFDHKVCEKSELLFTFVTVFYYFRKHND